MEDKKLNNSDDGLITLLLGLFITLLILKIEWYIDIPWIIVFAPIWLPILITILVVLFIDIFNKPKNKNDD